MTRLAPAHHADLWLPVNAPRKRPGLIRESIKLACLIVLWLFFYGVTP